MKRIICIIIAALCLLPCVSVSAAESVIYIGSFSQLSGIAARVNAGYDMQGFTLVLAEDISIEENYTPIGVSPQTPFAGVFDGNGKEVRLGKLVGGDFTAFFGCVSGTVKNLTVKGEVQGNNYAALVVGRLYAYSGATSASVENCKAIGTVGGDSYVGAVIGYAAANGGVQNSAVSVKDCVFEGEVTGDMYVGGIIGKVDAFGTKSAAVSVENCVSVAQVEAKGNVASLAGGIVGGLYAENGASIKVKNCVADCRTSASLLAAGGIVGACGADNAAVSIENCAAYGIATSPTVGGISADCGKENVVIENCIADITLIGDKVAVIGNAAVSGCFATKSSILAEGVVFAESLPPHPLYSPDAFYACGDINGDDKIGALDASILLQFDAAMAMLGSAALTAADVNDDGRISALDASIILQYDAMLVDKLPFVAISS